MKFVTGLAQVAAVVVVLLFVSILLAFPVKWTWNYCMPHIFGAPEITVLHAWCLQFLVTCLFRVRADANK